MVRKVPWQKVPCKVQWFDSSVMYCPNYASQIQQHTYVICMFSFKMQFQSAFGPVMWPAQFYWSNLDLVLEESLVDSSSPRKMIRLKRCLKSGKKQKQIENVPNSVNPNFYRRCHLEFARQFTLKSQGGYIGAFYLNLLNVLSFASFLLWWLLLDFY